MTQFNGFYPGHIIEGPGNNLRYKILPHIPLRTHLNTTELIHQFFETQKKVKSVKNITP